ncbi:hypothetical protein DOU02_11105 [Clavibacter michiganensis subsp. michiganensis]|nr:hypothetical protein DOU02_11105 [Clavibacter michiganensis subsp. michiganensis]
MELHTHLPDRQERLGREQQHEEPHLEVELPADEAHPHRHRHERDRQRRRELQHEAGQEGDAEHAHGLHAVLLRHPSDAGCLPPGAPEDQERRQPVDHVEEARSQLGEARPLPPLHLLRRPADEHHEDGDHGQRREDGHARERVGQGEHRHDDRRREGGEDQLRHVAREVRVERVESRAHDRREAPAAAAGRPGGAEVGDGPERASPQLGGDPGCAARTHHVEEPRRGAAHDGGSDDEREHRPELRRGRAADRPHDELGERPAEGDERDGLHDADQGSRGEHRARRRGVPQQPRIQGLHGAPSARPGRSRRA